MSNQPPTPNQAQLQAQRQAQFEKDGFVIVPDFLDAEFVAAARSRFEKLFAGEFETGIQPDEWNWREGRDSGLLTRQICNAWKSDKTIASIVLDSELGRMCAELRGWPGARINQDNVIWKPPGSKALGFHQDESYQNWIVPAEMITCWITLDDTAVEQGTIEYVRGSHRWHLADPIQQFHAPDDPLHDLRAAASIASADTDIVPIVVNAGTAVFHHGRTWHGSRPNTGSGVRRSVVAHCMSSDATFHPVNTSPVYSRYKRANDCQMDESFFPILWHNSGHRTLSLPS